MRLRIHFPWGLLLTALGFAGLGAAAAYWLVTDVHGHLYRQCLLQAIGAGLLGVLGWTFSERIAFVANLNTSPFLHLALPGAGAVYLAAEVAAPLTEFTAGSGAYWAELVAVGVYLAAGILPLVAGVALLAAGETLLAAQRGNADLASALRPVLPHALLGVVLAGLVGYSTVYLHDRIRTGVLAFVPDRVRASAWLERRKALFVEVLRGAACEVLVAPFETGEPQEAGPKRSLDRPARSIITRQVAAGIAAYTGLCVVDPTLVSRALGPRARDYDWSALSKLADATGARWIVRGSFALAEERRAYDVAVQIFSRGPGEKARWDGGQATQWGPVEFSDDLPPEAAFQPLVQAVVERLDLPPRSAAPAPVSSPQRTALPDSPAHLSGEAGSPVARAQRLQLVAVSYPGSDVDGEHLWERSLLAVAAAPAEDGAARVVRARAALHLYRRPYALALLGGLGSPEARAVHALAQGNLFEAETLVPRMSDPASVLITEVELEQLRSRYGRTAGYRARRDALLAKHPAYAPLLYVALSSDEWFQPASHDLIRRQLTSLGVTIPDDAPIALARRVAKQFGQELLFSSDIARLPVGIERAYARLWLARAAQWRGEASADRLAEWDLYDALFAANRAALTNSALSISSRQPRPEAYLEFGRDLGQPLAGYPALAGGTVGALGQLLDEPRTSSDRILEERQRRLVRDLVAWEGGETETERSVRDALPPELERAYLDEPPRAWRAPPYARPDWQAAGHQADTAKLERNAVHEFRALNYSQYSFEYLAGTHELLLGAGHKEQADQVAAQAQGRFIGNPARDAFLMRQARDKGDLPAYVALLEQKIREQPEDWSAYFRLATVQLQARQPDQAQRTLLSYPLFSGDKANPVELSTRAEAGGALLLWAGDAELARPLYRLSAQYGTGSGAEMWSLLRLAQLDRNWPKAGEWGRKAHDRYQDAWGLTDAAYTSFLIGNEEQGWRDFYQASKQFEDMRPWVAAIAGHRIAATGENELVGFVKRWKSLSGQPSVEAGLRQHFMFNMLMIDRTPSDKALGALLSAGTGSTDQTYKTLATGYIAFKRGSYSAAAESLGQLTTIGINKAENTKSTLAYTLPYFTASLVKAGRRDEAQELLASVRDRVGKDFYYLLASAYVDGLGGDTQKALNSLWLAQFEQPGVADVTLPPLFHLLETCEKLYELTGDDHFRQLLLELAVRQQAAWPWSWAYAFEAKHATDPRERERALGIALYLDPQSEHIAGFSAAQRKRAMDWFARNNPFKG